MIATIFDTETTGLIENPARKLDKQPEIISFACQTINLMTGEHYDEWSILIKPEYPIPPEITKITGISNNDVRTAPVMPQIIDDLILRLQSTFLLIGQNIRFDQDMIELECRRYNKHINWPKTLDLIQNTIHLKGFRLNLTNLHIELFGEPFTGAHQASVDVAITCKCAIELFKRGLL